jgi:YHS domain-containing protein
MRRYLWSAALGATLGLMGGCFVTGCGSGETSKPTPPPTVMPMPMPSHAAMPAASAAAAIAQKLCPVTGGPINPNIYVDYQGRRVYFCCNACPPVFLKDPAKYLLKLDAELAGAAASPAAASH